MFHKFFILNFSFLILLLASQAVAAAPFTDNGDGTVNDSGTGLIWQKCNGGLNNNATCSGSATTYTWANALTYCNTLSLASKTWRLPNRNELQSIVDYTKGSAPTIDVTAFPATQINSYWSSTTFHVPTSDIIIYGPRGLESFTYTGGHAWHVPFSSGGMFPDNKITFHWNVARCVSGP